MKRHVLGKNLKIKMELPFDSAIQLLRIYPNNLTNQKEDMHPFIHSSIIYSGQDLETAPEPMSR